MNKIELHQRKIIIKGENPQKIEDSKDALDVIKSHSVHKTDSLLLGIYSLGLLFMENPSDNAVNIFIQDLIDADPSLENLCTRIIKKSQTSNNRTENAIKEITKIALEISKHNE